MEEEKKEGTKKGREIGLEEFPRPLMSENGG